eukprot:10461698-Lingulodinium_polyedra.AAC.1
MQSWPSWEVGARVTRREDKRRWLGLVALGLHHSASARRAPILAPARVIVGCADLRSRTANAAA